MKSMSGSFIPSKKPLGLLIGVTKSLDYKKYKKCMQNLRNPQIFTKVIGQSQKKHELRR